MQILDAVLIIVASCAVRATASDDLVAVHEWGTFTSVADEDGSAMGWQPLSGPSDLPCFVHRLDQRDLKVAEYGTVRMETPVLYFYPLKPLNVSVHVDFPGGRVTEWYPRASNVQPSISRHGWVEWKDVRLGPSSSPFPVSGTVSHYYAARETDASALRSGPENEKLLFYRGIGDFAVDLKAVVHDDGVSIKNEGSDTIPEAILFENHAGKIGYHVLSNIRDSARVEFSALTGTIDDLRRQVEDELTEMGLYRKEAHAMVETWRDSWFEEGLRVMYILPRSKVDALLPISIRPAPGQLARVFVGRVELLSPPMRTDISTALASGDVSVLKKYGRFLGAFIHEMQGSQGDLPTSDTAEKFLERAYSQNLTDSRKLACTE